MAITKKDVETLKEVFATKKDIEALKEVFVTKTEFKEFERKVNTGFDRLLTGQDKLMRELEKSREDRLFAFAKDKDQDLMLDNLDRRVKRLETVCA